MKLILVFIVATLIPLCHAQSRLNAGETLSTGQGIANCEYQLTMQSDCNLVLYAGGRAIWATGTNGIGSGLNCFVTMQTDGNLVLYLNPGRRARWASNSVQGGSAAYYLSIQCDRNLVIYNPQGRAIWATGTNLALKGSTLTNTTSTNNGVKFP